MKHVGGSVVNGAFSTFLAIFPLAFAEAEVFQVIFYIFAFCVVMGTFQGLCVLPALLSFFGPPPHAAHSKPTTAQAYEVTTASATC